MDCELLCPWHWNVFLWICLAPNALMGSRSQRQGTMKAFGLTVPVMHVLFNSGNGDEVLLKLELWFDMSCMTNQNLCTLSGIVAWPCTWIERRYNQEKGLEHYFLGLCQQCCVAYKGGIILRISQDIPWSVHGNVNLMETYIL